MYLDYRAFVKFHSKEMWRIYLEKVTIEGSNGEEYNLFEISKVFNSPSDMLRIMEPIGMIFDTVTAVENEAFLFIHDHRKSFNYFKRLTYYLLDELRSLAEDDAVMIADLTDYDTDMMGDHIMYYLGGGEEGVKECIVEGPEGLDHHDIEISNFTEMLKYVTLSERQQQKLNDLTGGTYPSNLMDPMRLHLY